MDKTVKSIATNYGLYLGITLSIITALCYAFKIELLVNFLLIFLVLPIIVLIFGILSIIKSKSFLGGFISFKQSFTSYFITIALGLLISSVVSYILFTIIDPEAALKLKEIAIEKTAVLMEQMGATSDEIATQIDIIEKQDTQATSVQIFQYVKGLAFFSVIGLIISLIMKKKQRRHIIVLYLKYIFKLNYEYISSHTTT